MRRDQRGYWDRVAAEKVFTHPLNRDWVTGVIRPDARVLDYGCGYGRTLNELARMGYANGVGVDFSAAMVARGRREFPELDLRPTLADPDAAYDAVFLMAVLTCVPEDAEQDALMADTRRVLRPGGVLYVSDMPLQADARNLRRYAEAGFGTYGVFETEDGAIVRHHSDARFAALLGGFEVIATEDVPLTTMNGHAATARQFLARRPPG